MNPLNHVAIIMDGNGRWGLKNKNSRNDGHLAGLKNLKEIIKTTIEQNIKILTLYAFSTENWKRPKSEIDYLFNLLENFLINKVKKLHEKQIKIKILGKKNFSKKLNNLLLNCERLTRRNKILQVNLALNYGSKTEILDSFKSIVKKKITFNEKNISLNLYKKNSRVICQLLNHYLNINMYFL